ncbi:hypothetical protein V6N11_054721 [Hibiscus sabdariffa]|uniref:Cupin type-1 domain-containing protein n=1 Tax=Hibiscus sabdariffa TaxID=183260 RepID=A0ABR2S4R8_9ROSI
MRLKHSTDSSFVDIFNPRRGRITTVNGFNLFILHWLQLSAERGVFYNINVIYVPHWNINAHNIVYITRGNGRIQIVSKNGETIFDDQVQEGQMIIVPQNHAVLKKASRQGFEWIAFKQTPMLSLASLSAVCRSCESWRWTCWPTRLEYLERRP